MLRKREIKKFGNPVLLKQLMPLVSAYRVHVKFYLLLAGITAVIFLLARPQYGSKLETVKHKGSEIMIALDISNSMLAEDVLPNRLERSKQIISRMIDGFENDKIGLVVFAGDAFIQLPITSDFVSAKMFMSSISPNLISRQGTSIGAAIHLSLRSFPNIEGVGRSIIVITDGENHEDDAVTAAKQAAEQGVTVHVIGVGNPNGAPIPIEGTSGFRKDMDGNVVMTKLNEQMGREIAEAGNGIYVRADNSNSALRAISDELKNMSSSEIETKKVTEYNEQFVPIAWIVLLLLLLEFVILNRKNKLFLKFRLFDDKENL
jgi:Ca-activated chloride channel family protein